MKKATFPAIAVALVATAVMPARPSAAAFPGANGAVAYTVYFDGQTDICAVNPDGSNPRLVVSAPHDQGTPAWSPDGAKLAYTEFQHDDNSSSARIKVLDIATGVTTDLGEGAEPSWSPVGDQLAFTAEGIWVMDADGSNRRQVDEGFSSDPAWSPDGAKIAFFDDIRDGIVDEGDIWVTTPEGDPADNVSDYGPANWSPDGTQFVADGGFWALAILVMNADGSDQRTLVESDHVGNERVFGSTWSPDGARVAYIRSRAAARRTLTDIWTVPSAGGRERPLLETPNPKFDPDWQPVTQSTPVVPDGESCVIPLDERDITLRLREHLVATGHVVAESDSADCSRGWIRIRRRENGDWTWLPQQEFTNAEGRFRIKLKDRSGRYSAVVVGDGECAAATSPMRKHGH